MSYHVERIEWIDSVSSAGWRTPADVIDTHERLGVVPIVSVGWVIRDDDVAVTLCLSVGGVTSEHGDCMTIPLAVIRSRKRLRAR